MKFIQYRLTHIDKLKVLLCTLFCLSSLFAWADPAAHGRYSDLVDDYEPSTLSIVIPIILLVGLGGLFLYFWLKDFWSKNKDGIQSVLGFIAVIAVVAFVGKCSSESNKSSNQSSNSSPSQYTSPTQQQQHSQPQNYAPVRQLRYRTEYYDETCDRCHGTGRVTCDRCGGRGYVEVYCQECNGQGYTTETRYDIEYNDPLDFMSGVKSRTPYTEKMYCFHCGGTGKLRSGCPKCGIDNSSTQGMFATTISCQACNGNGTIQRSLQVPYYE